jgi:hypothetical protein
MVRRGLLLLAVFFAATLPAFAQGGYFSGSVTNTAGQAIAGATVSVCAYSSANYTNGVYSGPLPCPNPIQVFMDPQLTIPVVSPSGSITTDGQGNFQFYTTSGNATVTVTSSNFTFLPRGYSISVPCAAGSSTSACTVSGTNILPLPNNFTGATNTFKAVVVTALQDTALGPSLLVCTDGSSNLTTAGCPSSTFSGGTVPNPTTFSSSLFACGVNPWADTTCANMRAVSSVPSTTATVSGTTAVTLVSGTGFQNNDGIVIYGAGPASTLPQPTITSVTPSLARAGMNTGHAVTGLTTGSTTYSYTIAAIDRSGGFSPCSAAVATTIGQAQLGPIASIAVSTVTRANNVMTFNTTGASGLAPNATFYYANGSDATFSGQYIVVSTPTTSQFTALQGQDTRGGNSVTTSATGGTITIYNSNHLVLPTSGGFQFYVWTNGANPRPTIPGATYWDDYGQVAPPIPSYVPASCPGSATNDYLATTIVSGGGTASIVVASAATQTASGLTALFDDGPGLKAAFVSATTNPTNASVHLPASPTGTTYPINSHQVMPNTSVTFLQSSSLTFNESVEFGGGLKWTGDLGGSCTVVNQFAFGPAACVNVGSAYPAVVIPAPATVTTVAFNGQSNGLLAILSQGGTFSSSFDHDQFAIPGSTDITGGGLYMMGTSLTHIDHTLFSVNDTPTYGYSIAPMLASINNPANTQGAGSFTCDFCYAVGRGALVDSTPAVGSQQNYFLNSSYSQAIRTPWLTIGTANNAIIHVKGGTQDSSTQAMVSNQGANAPTVILDDVQNVSAESGGTPGILTGSPFSAVIANMSGTSLGQNMNVQRDRPNSNACLAGLSINGSNVCSSGSFPVNVELLDSPVHVGPAFDIFFPLSVPVPVSTSISGTSGGSVPVGAQVYTATAWGYDGNTTNPSASVTCTTTSGNQTCAPSFTFSAGTLFYSVYRNGQGVVACNHLAITASCSDTVSSAGGGPAPTVNASGSTTLTAGGLYSPCITTYAIFCSNQFPGATLDVRVNACITAAIAVGGFCDSRSEPTTETIAAPILVGTPTPSKVSWLVPEIGQWTSTITSGTGCAITQYGLTSIVGTASMYTTNMTVKTQSSTNEGAVYCTGTTSSALSYMGMSGMTFKSSAAGATNTLGATAVISDVFESNFDNDEFFTNIDACAVKITGTAGADRFHIGAEGLSGTGVTPLCLVGTTGGFAQDQLNVFNCDSCSINHPGAGQHNITITDGGGSAQFPTQTIANFYGLRMEGNQVSDLTTSAIFGTNAKQINVFGGMFQYLLAGASAPFIEYTYGAGKGTSVTGEGLAIGNCGGCATPTSPATFLKDDVSSETISGNALGYGGPGYLASAQAPANARRGTVALVGGTATVTFPRSYPTTPVCTANDQTAANAVQTAPTTTVVVLTGTSTDTIAWSCAD